MQLALLVIALKAGEALPERPNVLMMVVDDLRPRFGVLYNDTEVFPALLLWCKVCRV